MVNQRATSTLVVNGFVAALACLFALVAGTARAQGTLPNVPPSAGQRDPFAEVRERQQREAQLRSAEMLGASKSGRFGSEAAVEQLKEDFRSIQVLRNKLVRHLQSGQPLDYKFVAIQAEEINRRAGRLKTHLLRVAPGSEKKETPKPPEIAADRMTGALVQMCRRIDSFTESPVFKVPDVVNVEQSAQVGSDLRDIIQLSESIKKTAERLHKAQRK